MMTKDEFRKGWLLLILQTWAARYNRVHTNGTPTADAVEQFNFYYSKLSWAHPDAWLHVAERYAEGKEWPSLQDLKVSLQHANEEFIKAVPDRSEKQFCECPTEAAEIIERILGRSIRAGTTGQDHQ